MLVHFHQGLVLEGSNTKVKRVVKHGRIKRIPVDNQIYLFTDLQGICEESEVEARVTELIAEELAKDAGWGKGFKGWERVLPPEEYPTVAKAKKWDLDEFPKGILEVEPIRNWPLHKIMKELTGKQFAKFCLEKLRGD